MNRAAQFLVLALILAGCHRRTPIAALPPAVSPPVSAPSPEIAPPDSDRVPALPLTPVPPSTPAPRPVPAPPAPSPLERADDAFSAGNYAEAAREYDNYLQHQTSGPRRDEALFRLALALALPPNTNPDWNRITLLLKQLIDQYPQSGLKPAATVILSLATDSQRRIRQLSTELEKLKQIDAERRKRP